MALAHEKQQTVVWRPLAELDAAPLDARLRELIRVGGSLTRSLRRLCGSDFRLRVIGERAGPGVGARIREVLMSCGDTPWVFAQTVIPATTLARNPWLADLGDRPLGDRLFERPDVERTGLRFGRLPSGDALFERALADAGLAPWPSSLWARRSAIRIRDDRLSVNEVFLPDAGRCA